MIDFLQSLFNNNASQSANPNGAIPPFLANPQILSHIAQQQNNAGNGAPSGMPNLMQMLPQMINGQQQQQQPMLRIGPMLQSRLNAGLGPVRPMGMSGMPASPMPTNTPMNNAMGSQMPTQSILPALMNRRFYLSSNNS